MTRPTEGEIRAEPAGRRLDAWVAEYVTSWKAQRVMCDFNGIPWPDEVPHYSTDPAACAELKRHLWESGVFASIECETRIGTTLGPFVCVVLVPRNGDMDKLISSNEDIATDPIAAECVAWCRAALIAAKE